MKINCKKIIAGSVLTLGMFGLFSSGCNMKKETDLIHEEKKEIRTSLNYEELLRNAKEIEISERIFNIGKDYDLYADGSKVGRLYGKDIKLWADEFKLETEDGKLLASEKEHKRILRLTRCAAVYNKHGELIGYIGEETKTKLFSIGYFFHFYDANKNQIGTSDEVNFSILKKNNFYDNKGNLDYIVKKSFNPLKDVYTLEVKDQKSEIPLEVAIFMVCIEDAIYDAKKSEENKKNND
ncbi:MAG: hypothetical protein Q8O03_08875 [Nanoarchaeota archaeon]|nr:hypothetical protein [Nanoarchaeota archaeon]